MNAAHASIAITMNTTTNMFTDTMNTPKNITIITIPDKRARLC